MQELSRRLYKRGGSHEVTIPKTIIWNIDIKKKYDIIFDLVKGRWSIGFQEAGKKKSHQNQILRRLYKRGDSYETTLPHPILFGLDPNKEHDVIFIFDNNWFISFREVKWKLRAG